MINNFNHKSSLPFYYITIFIPQDATGTPIGMMYRTTSYAEGAWDVFWYEKNLQGDIIAVYNASGTKVATYTYFDAWGNHFVSYSNGGGSTGAQYNPFRYRGYYYDIDLGMYYLQSRYYDAKICRFINADGYVSTGQGILGNNMFAYCNNDPVMGYDPTGMWTFTISIGGDLTLLLFGCSEGLCFSIDDDWNFVIMDSYSLPNYINDNQTLHYGIIDINIPIGFQYTNDDTVYDLCGATTYVGTSLGCGEYGTVELVYSNHNPLQDDDFGKITGFQVSFGPGIGYDPIHLKTTQSRIIYETNLRDLINWRRSK